MHPRALPTPGISKSSALLAADQKGAIFFHRSSVWQSPKVRQAVRDPSRRFGGKVFSVACTWAGCLCRRTWRSMHRRAPGRASPPAATAGNASRASAGRSTATRRATEDGCLPLPDGIDRGNTRICAGGRCVCPPGTVACEDGCVPPCTGAAQALNPVSCLYYGIAGNPVECPTGTNRAYCTASCDTTALVCVSRSIGEAREFAAQCASKFCAPSKTCAALTE